MCFSCWKEYGNPMIVNDKVLKAVDLIESVYKNNDVGGNLHIQLDDWNIEDCYWEEFEQYDKDSSLLQIAVETHCFLFMKELSLEERASALALYDNFFVPQ